MSEVSFIYLIQAIEFLNITDYFLCLTRVPDLRSDVLVSHWQTTLGVEVMAWGGGKALICCTWQFPWYKYVFFKHRAWKDMYTIDILKRCKKSWSEMSFKKSYTVYFLKQIYSGELHMTPSNFELHGTLQTISLTKVFYI